MTGEVDARTAAWMANIPDEPIVNPFRRRTVTYGVEEDLVLPGHVIATDTVVRDCIIKKVVDGNLGAIARPKRVHFVTGLPKTRSGKMLRRSIQALAEGRDAGDLTTIDDPSTLEQIKAALAG